MARVRAGRAGRIGLLVATAVTVLASCTSTIAGDAAPPPPPVPAPPPPGPDPCALLTPQQASGLGLAPAGKFAPGESDRLVPPSCEWRALDPADEFNPLTVYYSSDVAIAEYFTSGQSLEQAEFGGRTWGRYSSAAGEDYCYYATELAPLSFVAVLSKNTSDPIKACDRARAAAPIVAEHLPSR